VGFVSTYPPRACGIATYTRDLARALLLRDQIENYLVVAISEENGNRYSDHNVKGTINQHQLESYLTAADFLNASDVELVNIQHEYGIYGGEWGEYVLELYRNLKKPIVTTLHTVLQNLPKRARMIESELIGLSDAVVVTIGSAAKLLQKRNLAAQGKINVVRHGAALPERGQEAYARKYLKVQKNTVLATSGLINPGKGIEYAIEALSYLVKKRPELLFLVIGETHPEVRKHEGEAYREKLITLAKQLHVERNVRFIDRYLRDDELCVYLQAVDIYVAPYLGKEQVSSGTITLALSHGKAIVSTPTLYATEELAGNRGLLCEFEDGRSIAKCIARILNNPRLRQELELNAYKYAQRVGWREVADRYGDIYRFAIGSTRTVRETAAVSETRPSILSHG
jgi:glycosyltransferase involved in cell wall biosynthesis